MPRCQKTGIGLGLLLIGGSCWPPAGCAARPAEPAPAAQVVLTAEQGSRAMHIMAAAVPPAHGPPLQLLPTSGVRWSDLRRAMGTIAMPPRPSGGETLTAVVASDIGDDRAWFELLTSDGWPAVVRATRCGDGIQLEAWMGPYPTAPEAVDAARSLQAAAAESLRQWGRKPELPAEAVSR